jgi:hypothetical protein
MRQLLNIHYRLHCYLETVRAIINLEHNVERLGLSQKQNFIEKMSLEMFYVEIHG